MINFIKYTAIVFFCFFSISIYGQVVMQIEKTGSIKKERYYIGDEIEFETANFPGVWQKRIITDIRPDDNVFISNTDMFNLSNVLRVRRISPTTSVIASVLYSIGGTSIIGSATAYTFGFRPDNWTLVIIFAVAPFGVGWLVSKLFKYKTFRIGPNRRLRALDLTYYPPEDDW